VYLWKICVCRWRKGLWSFIKRRVEWTKPLVQTLPQPLTSTLYPWNKSIRLLIKWATFIYFWHNHKLILSITNLKNYLTKKFNHRMADFHKEHWGLARTVLRQDY
jgi:hypothetical protein